MGQEGRLESAVLYGGKVGKRDFEENSSRKSLRDKLLNFEIIHPETNIPTKLYDSSVVTKLEAMPPYVAESMGKRLSNPSSDKNYDKIVVDKWGRKDAVSKLYVETPEMVFYRTAMLVAEGFKSHDPNVDYDSTVRDIFMRMANRELFPNTPYMANGGHHLVSDYLLDHISKEDKTPELLSDLEKEKRVREQLFACFVLDMYDSRESIFDTMKEAGEIHAHVGGTGFNFSNLRPANETIHGSGGITDGPVSFMSAYSYVLGKTMNQGGKREGANMFMLDHNHPDIMWFFYSKREDGEIPAANISVAIGHDFMKSVFSEGEERFYPLKNPHFNSKKDNGVSEFYTADQLRHAISSASFNKKAKVSLGLDDDNSHILSPWIHEGLGEEYRVIGKIGDDGLVYLDSHKVMKHLAFNAWYNGEPGMIMTGHINDANPTHPKHFRDYLIEQGDEESRQIIDGLKSKNPQADLESLIDNYVNERDGDGRYINLPVGVGVIRATNPCGEKPLLPDEACVLGHNNLESILVEDSTQASGYGVDRSKFRGYIRTMYEILDNAIDQNYFTLSRIEKTQKSNRKIGMGFMGLANMLYKLELPYNSREAREFVDDLLEFWEKESDEASFDKAEKFGVFPNFRYSHHRKGKPKRNAIVRTLAPTGTTSFVAMTSGGMEPEYALAYSRTTVQGTTIDIFNPILEEKLSKYSFFADDNDRQKLYEFINGEGKGSLQGFEIKEYNGESRKSFDRRKDNLDKIKRIFVTTYDISPGDHIRMQAVVQNHVDDAISKTTNFRNNATVEDVEETFKLAYQLGIKGLTFYREGTRKGAPLKVKGEDIEEPGNGKWADARMAVMDHISRPRPEFVLGGIEEKVSTPFGINAFVGINYEVDESGKVVVPYEVFINAGKSSQDVASMTEGYGRLISMLLKAGIQPEFIADQLIGIGGQTQTGYGEGKIMSLADAIGKGIRRAREKERKIGFLNSSGNESKERDVEKSSGNMCPQCTGPLKFEESCEKCFTPGCGFTRC